MPIHKERKMCAWGDFGYAMRERGQPNRIPHSQYTHQRIQTHTIHATNVIIVHSINRFPSQRWMHIEHASESEEGRKRVQDERKRSFVVVCTTDRHIPIACGNGFYECHYGVIWRFLTNLIPDVNWLYILCLGTPTELTQPFIMIIINPSIHQSILTMQ